MLDHDHCWLNKTPMFYCSPFHSFMVLLCCVMLMLYFDALFPLFPIHTPNSFLHRHDVLLYIFKYVYVLVKYIILLRVDTFYNLFKWCCAEPLILFLSSLNTFSRYLYSFKYIYFIASKMLHSIPLISSTTYCSSIFSYMDL